MTGDRLGETVLSPVEVARTCLHIVLTKDTAPGLKPGIWSPTKTAARRWFGEFTRAEKKTPLSMENQPHLPPEFLKWLLA
jgi:hypothetical protein